MKDEIFLHIGVPKTGTTQLQEAFRENVEVLRGKDIFYPRNGRYYASGVGSQKFLAWSFLPQLPQAGSFSKHVAAKSFRSMQYSIDDLARDVQSSSCSSVLLFFFLRNTFIMLREFQESC